LVFEAGLQHRFQFRIFRLYGNGFRLLELFFGSQERISCLSFDFAEDLFKTCIRFRDRYVLGNCVKTTTGYHQQYSDEAGQPAPYFSFSGTQGKLANNQLHSFGLFWVN
jgi:hypothetical protein